MISTQEQTQDELGLVLRNRKDGHVCIVSVCPELCPALYEAARRGFMVPGHRIASIDGQWLGAGNELEFDVVAAMASSRDHSGPSRPSESLRQFRDGVVSLRSTI